MKLFKFSAKSGDNECYKSIINALLDKKYDVIAPVQYKNALLFRNIKSPDEVIFPSEYINTVRSAKEYIFPISEPVIEFTYENKTLKLEDCEPVNKVRIIFGLRPCDAAAFPILDDVFNHTYKDDFFNKRRENTILISAACENSDESCFCTSVGVTPDGIAGSDIFLKKTRSNEIAAFVNTERGEKIAELLSGILIPINEATDQEDSHEIYKQVEDKIRKPLELSKIKSWLDNNFEHKAWNSIGASCMGCATCAYLCPTCHCFDLVDEMKYDHGFRRKNWDVCQFPVFTLHASGHNPRPSQTKRYRQRVMHKFKYYKEKFNKTLCTGCGRCIRSCPVNLDIYQVVKEIGVL